MKETGRSGIVCVLFFICFLFNVSTVAHTGIRIMFPTYVYGSYDENVIWEEVTQEQIHADIKKYVFDEINRLVCERILDEKGEVICIF